MKHLSIEDIFEFRTAAFNRELGVEDIYEHPQYEEAVTDVVDIVRRRESVVLTAVPGSGKTVVARRVMAQLPPARYRVHEIKVTRLGMRDFCRELTTAVGARPAAHTGALIRSLQTRFRDAVDTESIQPVIIIDEAQDIWPDVLSLLKLITNCNMDSRLVVSFVLLGQPKLLTLLAHPDLEDVARRIARYVTLRLLSREETAEYIQHRLRVVGGKDDLFDKGALDAIFECTKGNMRAVDRVAFESLHVAAHAGRKVVGTGSVIKARAKVML
jgi:general secretion pathway protein A